MYGTHICYFYSPYLKCVCCPVISRTEFKIEWENIQLSVDMAGEAINQAKQWNKVCSLLTQGSAWATGGAEYINVIKDLLLNIARGTTDPGILVRNKVHNLDLLQLEIFHQVTQPHFQRASVTSVNSEQGVLMTIDIQAQRSEPRLGPIKLYWVSLSIATLRKGAPGLFFSNYF